MEFHKYNVKKKKKNKDERNGGGQGLPGELTRVTEHRRQRGQPVPGAKAQQRKFWSV